MGNSAYRQPGLKGLSDASRGDLEAVLTNLVETGRVTAEVINAELDSLREITGERAKIVSETDKKPLTPEQQDILLGKIKSRFEMNRQLHETIRWSDVENALKAGPEKLWSLRQLEATDGEPDVIGEEEGEFVFGDCSMESPAGRCNVVYDKEAEEYLKNHCPGEICNGNATDQVKEMGVDFMDEEQYRALEKKLAIDKNTWSWIGTPADIRKSGFALVADGHGVEVGVTRSNATFHSGRRAWRAVLRVPKA